LGAEGRVEGKLTLVGRRSLLTERGIVLPLDDGAGSQPAVPGPIPAQKNAGRTTIWVAVDGRFAGSVALSDRARPGARAVVAQLTSAGMRVVMLTGDQESSARAIAQELGIQEVIAGVLPEGKLETLRKFQAEGRKVAMVGDGINDAPALAAAHVGVALASGTDVAREAADLTLMRPDLSLIVQARALARSAVRLMKQNLFWALAYNAVCIPVAAGVLYPAFGILLSPVIASAAMALSSVSVVGNSLRLAAWRRT
jgi:Cu+-exporting ATPase